MDDNNNNECNDEELTQSEIDILLKELNEYYKECLRKDDSKIN